MSGIFRGAGSGSGGGGDVTGPASSTDNAVVRFDGATGKIIQNSTATLSDAGLLSIASLNLTSALDIPYGGTGQTTQTAAFDALSPTTAKGSIIVHNGSDNVELAVGIDGQVLTANSAEATGLEWTSAGAGDVTAAANLSDNTIIRGDGGLKGVQDSGITIDDSDVVSGVTQLNVDNLRLDGNTISSTDANGNINLTPNGSGVIAGTQLTLTTALDETYGGTAQTTYTTGDILYASASNTLSKLAVSTNPGAPLITDGTNVSWFNPDKQFYCFDDFITAAANDSSSILGWTRVIGSGGSIGWDQASNTHPGVVNCNSGTTTGYAGLQGGIDAFTLGGGRIRISWYMKLINLSDGTDTFNWRLGLGDRTAPTFYNNGIWFDYTHSQNSGAWVIKDAGFGNNSANTSSTVDTNWHKYTIDINAAGTTTRFYIDNVEVSGSPLTTTANTTLIGPGCVLQMTAGTADRRFFVDAFEIFVDLTSNRF